jgi:hypothetical protein
MHQFLRQLLSVTFYAELKKGLSISRASSALRSFSCRKTEDSVENPLLSVVRQSLDLANIQCSSIFADLDSARKRVAYIVYLFGDFEN